jgi:hypothetical protein
VGQARSLELTSAFLQLVVRVVCTTTQARSAEILVPVIRAVHLAVLVVAVIGTLALAAVLLKLVRGTVLRAAQAICGPLIPRITAVVEVAAVRMVGLLLVALVAVVMVDNVLIHRTTPPALMDLAAALVVTPITAAAVPGVLA